MVEVEATAKPEDGEEKTPAVSPNKTNTASKGVKESTGPLSGSGDKQESASPGAKVGKAVKGGSGSQEKKSQEKKMDGNGKSQKTEVSDGGGKNGNGKAKGVRIIEPQSKGNN